LLGEFGVNRRYSDFVLIREIFVERFPKVAFMPLPSDKSFVISFENLNLNFVSRVMKE